jgi:hypothetical protein
MWPVFVQNMVDVDQNVADIFNAVTKLDPPSQYGIFDPFLITKHKGQYLIWFPD